MTTAVVVGGGQAGLCVSRGLSLRGVDHLVLERDRVASAWRSRWNSFTLVTPNWTLGLPGSPYAGDDPEGHVARDAIVEHLEAYAKRWAVPVREGVTVGRNSTGERSRFRLATSDGPVDAESVVVCTGAFQRPFRPPAGVLPPGVAVLDAATYRNPGQLPHGKVLVIGSGQTGCQLAEELHLAGREVFLSCGRAPWNPRRLDGLDAVTWAHRVRFFDQPLAALPSPAGRLVANPQVTGARRSRPALPNAAGPRGHHAGQTRRRRRPRHSRTRTVRGGRGRRDRGRPCRRPGGRSGGWCRGPLAR